MIRTDYSQIWLCYVTIVVYQAHAGATPTNSYTIGEDLVVRKLHHGHIGACEHWSFICYKCHSVLQMTFATSKTATTCIKPGI